MAQNRVTGRKGRPWTGTRPRLVPRKSRGNRYLEKRVEILNAAAAVFRRHGYHGASVQKIAHELGMTKGNLYYYFKDKEEILYFCHDYSLDLLLDLLKREKAEVRGPAEHLHQLIVAFVHMIIDELKSTALTLDLLALSPAHLRRVIAKRDRFDRAIRRLIEEGMREGVFAQGDPKLLAFAILGAVNWITRWFDPSGEATSDAIGRTFADYLIAGLRAGTSAPQGARQI